MVWVKAIIDRKLYAHVTGQIIRLWGHDFEVQQDGSLCLEMNSGFVDSEVRAGRIKKLNAPPPGKSKTIHEDITIIIPDDFTLDIGNYYGAGDLNKLIEKITAMKKAEVIKFADNRFTNHRLKRTMKAEDIIDKIRSLIDSAFLKAQKGK